jgi:hypothetical protein
VVLWLEDDEGLEIGFGCSRPSKAAPDRVGIGWSGVLDILVEGIGVIDVVVRLEDPEAEPELNCSQFPKPANCCFSCSSFFLLSSASCACFCAIVKFFDEPPAPAPDIPSKLEKASPEEADD